VIAVGDFVVDAAAQRAGQVGASDEVGISGLVHAVTPDHVDTATGEVGDLLHVATRHHGQLRFEHLAASDAAESWRCGRVDAAGYVQLCQRFIARVAAKKERDDPRAVEVLALATGIKRDPTHPSVARDVPPASSIFPTDDERAAWTVAHPDEAAGFELKQRLDADVAARRERNRAS